MEVFASCERKEENVDGKVSDCRFRQLRAFAWSLKESFTSVMPRQIPSRPALKWSSVLNFLTSLISFFTLFLSIPKEDPLISCFTLFSIHSKGGSYHVKSAEEELSLVHQCKELLDRNTNNTRMRTGITGAINEPQRHVSTNTMASVALLELGLHRLYDNLQPLNYSITNLLYDV